MKRISNKELKGEEIFKNEVHNYQVPQEVPQPLDLERESEKDLIRYSNQERNGIDHNLLNNGNHQRIIPKDQNENSRNVNDRNIEKEVLENSLKEESKNDIDSSKEPFDNEILVKEEAYPKEDIAFSNSLKDEAVSCHILNQDIKENSLKQDVLNEGIDKNNAGNDEESKLLESLHSNPDQNNLFYQNINEALKRKSVQSQKQPFNTL